MNAFEELIAYYVHNFCSDISFTVVIMRDRGHDVHSTREINDVPYSSGGKEDALVNACLTVM